MSHVAVESSGGISRRTVLQGGLIAGALLAAPALAAEDEPLKILDTHQHLWDLKQFRLPWLAAAKGKLAKDHLPVDYLKAVESLNVVKAIYMEVDVVPEQHVAEAEYVLKLTEDPKNLTVAAVIGGRPASETFGDYVARFKDDKRIIGVREVLHGATRRGYCLQKPFIRGVQLLGEHGKTFDLCMRPSELADAVKLVDACPDTRFILDHCGNGDPYAFMKNLPEAAQPAHEVDQYRRDIEALARREHVVCKISGIVARMQGYAWKPEDLAPVINICLEAFGPDRVMFASDWPVCTQAASYAEWVQALKEIVRDRPLEERKKLFYDNAAKFYGV